MSEFRLEVGQVTDVGRKRTVNEDNLGAFIPADPALLAQIGALFVVADGMGGHAKGEVASAIAVSTIVEEYQKSTAPTLGERLVAALREANAAIWDEASRQVDHAGMGTTVVCGVVVGDELLVTNAGDSRAYLVRLGRAQQLTRDHSWVGEMVALGKLTVAEARRHRMRNVITRCLGGRPDLEVPLYPRQQLVSGDALVLCSDGLWGTMTDQEIGLFVSKYPPQEAAERLVALANERGGPDNITVIVVRVQREGGVDDGDTLDLRLADDMPQNDETLRGVEDDLR
ncbi:MAG TPA: Stp1/IreP family PP2C-type Ser/Thr phosphatase [Chloroflexota bacterium]|nr:Stp1/IreP family PP2C-type Ser/Thr phosphatase [Chloroflexota bacterium]